MRFRSYDTEGFYDEMFEDGGRPRPGAQLLLETVEALSDGHLLRYASTSFVPCFLFSECIAIFKDGMGKACGNKRLLHFVNSVDLFCDCHAVSIIILLDDGVNGENKWNKMSS